MSGQRSSSRVVVVGGSGFLGSHVADHLSDAGHSVVIVDRTESPWLRKEQEMVIGDLLDRNLLDEVISGATVVYNFAAIADLDLGMRRPASTAEVNIYGNALLLEASYRHTVERYVLASTVYVNSREGGFYGCSKRAAEDYVREFGRQLGMDFTILRYGSLYGPRAGDSNGLQRIVQQALSDGAIRYSGSPEAIREYVHVDDAARASLLGMEDEFANLSVVITGLESIRVADLLEMLAEILGYTDEVTYVSGDQPGHYIRTPYADRVELSRKFIPAMTIDLGQGILEVIDNLRSSVRLATESEG
jgi:UDP-glucose 4-epimerase